MSTDKPLCLAFNVAVITMANRVCPTGYDVSPDAPQTLEELKAHVEKTKRITVWDGHCDQTIYACAETNYAFRAWHDWTHLFLQAPFNDKGERAVCVQQQAHLMTVFGTGRNTDRFLRLIYFEVMEQQDFKNTFGHFPDNQIGLAINLGY